MRPLYAELIDTLDRLDLEALTEAVAAEAAGRGVSFVLSGVEDTFTLDPVPCLIAADEWSLLELGLAQRVRALDRFVADAYAGREILTAGGLPERALESCDHFEPRLRRAARPAGAHRGRRPRRRALSERTLRHARGQRAHPVGGGRRDGLRASVSMRTCRRGWRTAGGRWTARWSCSRGPCAARRRRASAIQNAVILSDGLENGAWYEHQRLARLLDIPIVTLEDLSVRAGRLEARAGRGRLRVDVVYRRTDEDRLTDEQGELDRCGCKPPGAPLRTARSLA